MSGTAVPRIHVAAGTIRTVQLPATTVLHGESYKRLAPARKKTQTIGVQSIHTTVNWHNSQTEHRAPSKATTGHSASFHQHASRFP